jgi:two-component system, NtrC family, sensor kinase
MKRLRTVLGKVPHFTRDWRIRVLVPVLLVNLAAFAGLYVLMDRYAMSNLINTHKFGALLLLDEFELDLHDFDLMHQREALAVRFRQHSSARNLLAVNIYDADGQPIVATRGTPAARESAQAAIVFTQPQHPTMWLTEGEKTSNIFGVRALRNDASCNGCHPASLPIVGVLQVGIDMTAPIADAKTRVQRNFMLAGGAWVSLLGLMFWTGGVVIGRPLAAMRKSISAAGLESRSDAPGHDLQALADRVHDSLWSLIREQKKRETDITAHMARAEQLAALGQLAAGLTHEIKNPLAGISAALELLLDEKDRSDPNIDIYEQILGELARVSGTVDALLRLAKPQPPQRIRLDLARLSREVTSLFAARLRRQGVQLDLAIAEDVPSLQLDSGLMVQLLMNLLTNAMQATERGGTVTVFVAPFPRHDGVVLAVRDSGSGITDENLARIFDPFFTTKEEGTGLGLPICKQIVEQHGGTMSIDSSVGVGTSVTVLLPRLESNQETEVHGDAAAG